MTITVQCVDYNYCRGHLHVTGVIPSFLTEIIFPGQGIFKFLAENNLGILLIQKINF